MAKPASGRSHGKRREPEINLLPIMNLFCMIIPFLLLSASFLEMSVIEMTLPERIGTTGTDITNLARSEERQLQPEVIMTGERMFLRTVFGTKPVCNVIREERDGKPVNSYDMQALSKALEEFGGKLDREFPTIPVRMVTILVEDDVRYDNIVMVIDVCAEHGFDRPGLQVETYEVIQGRLDSLFPGGD